MEIEEDIISKNFISIMIVFKNEGRYLKEWIDFHLLSGIDHFYMIIAQLKTLFLY